MQVWFRRSIVAAAALASLFGSACGARSGLTSGEKPDAGLVDAGRDGAVDRPPDAGVEDAGTEPDRDCPPEARRGDRCEVAEERICFYPRGRGLVGCRCIADRWVCERAVCDGWGAACRGSVREDVCSGALGCGACCSLAGRAPLSTWCACDDEGVRPHCAVDDVCRGP